MPERAASVFIACALAILIGLAAHEPAHAATFTVTSTDDAGPGSLREAVEDANASPDADNTIAFDAALANSTIVLASELVVSNGSLTLDATASPGLTIDAGGGTFLENVGGSTAVTLSGVHYTNGAITLFDHALTFDEPGTVEIDGEALLILTPFTKTGAGTVTLNAGRTIEIDEIFSAASRIGEGTFVVDGAFLGAEMTVEAPGTLEIGGSVEATSLVDLGVIIVNAGGSLSADALLVESSGALEVDGSVAVTNDLTDRGAVVVNPGGELSAGTLLVDGTMNVLSGGLLTASSLDVGVSGITTVDGSANVTGGTVTDRGILTVNGSLTADSLIVESGGLLAGDPGGGMGVFAPVTVRGRVAPSTPAGTFRVEGPVAFESGSALEVEIQAGDTGDRLDVTGGAITIAPGAQLDIVATPSDFAAPSTVTLLTADGGISGQFTPTDYAVLEEILDYQANSLTLTLTRTGFSNAALTPNQLAVARTLDAASATATADLQAVIAALDTTLAGEAPALLDAIGGEPLTAFATGRQILAERTARALHRRTRDAAWGEGNAFYAGRVDVRAPTLARRPSAPPRGLLAAVGTPPDGTPEVVEGDAYPIGDARTRAGAWLDGFGLVGNLEGDAGEAEVETILYGGTLGVDAWLAERVLLGLAAGYARSDLEADGRDADLAGDTIQGAVYAGWTDPRGFLSAYGRYAYSFQDSTRRIESTQLSRNARAQFDAQDYGAGAEAGITLLTLGRFALQPMAGVDWLRLTEESYREKSAGDLGLLVDPEDLESVTGRFGGRVFGKIDLDGAGELVPELRAFWQREFGDTERVLDARLSGAPGLPAAGVRGPELPRDVLLLGVGWSASVNEQLQLLLDYDALLDTDRVEHQGSLAVRARF